MNGHIMRMNGLLYFCLRLGVFDFPAFQGDSPVYGNQEAKSENECTQPEDIDPWLTEGLNNNPVGGGIGLFLHL